MKKSPFFTPLLQSGAVLLAIVFIIMLMPSSDSMSLGSVVGSFFSGIFKALLFIFALALGLAFSIAVLIGIFLIALAIHSPEKASETYAGLKRNLFALLQIAPNKVPAVAAVPTTPIISEEEYALMKTELSNLQSKNLQLQDDVSNLSVKNAKMQDDIHTLNIMVDELKNSESQIKELLDELSAKVKQEPDSDLKDQIQQLESMHQKTNESISDLAGRLAALEQHGDDSDTLLTNGIFAYVEKQGDQSLFSDKIAEAVSQDMTYAQIDEFLTNNLPTELDQIIKDHPSLTKDYIRSIRN